MDKLTNIETKENQQNNVLALVRSRRNSLAASEARVAAWILQDPQRLIKLSMAQVANASGVSDTTVLRFCRTLGFAGFTDLKLALARDLATPSETVFGKIKEDDTVESIAQKVFLSNIQALRDTLQLLDMNQLQRAADLIDQAKRIFIFGVGTSGPIVKIAENYFFRLGKTCISQTDSYLQLMEAATLDECDVVLAVSQSGSSVDPVLTVSEAKKNGARVIVITGNAESPFTEAADVVLISVSNETRAETISSRLAQISLIDTLFIILSLRDVSSASNYEKRIWEAIMPKMI